jgi:hypothetical protein
MKVIVLLATAFGLATLAVPVVEQHGSIEGEFHAKSANHRR